MRRGPGGGRADNPLGIRMCDHQNIRESTSPFNLPDCETWHPQGTDTRVAGGTLSSTPLLVSCGNDFELHVILH